VDRRGAENCESTAYYRARYYNSLTGRFLSRDPEAGKPVDPKSLHKYLYAGGDPVNRVDPTGRGDFLETGLIDSEDFIPIRILIRVNGLGCAANSLLNHLLPTVPPDIRQQFADIYCDIIGLASIL
jgi:RHS repeat-associated protein